MNIETLFTMLLIEDDKDMATALTEYLRNHGIKVCTVDTLRLAERCLNLIRFDFVICDLSLPGEDGKNVISKIHQNFPRVPIIVFTGHDVCWPELQELGAVAVIQKPCKGEELVEKILGTVNNFHNKTKTA